jgi:arginyl-tRNA synthetase
MHIFADIHRLVLDVLNHWTEQGALPAGLSFDAVTVEPPRDTAHGDMATNAALVLAKPAGLKPREIAEFVSDKLLEDPRIAHVDIAGAGFLNIRLSEDVWAEVTRAALELGSVYGRSAMGAGRKVNVEYVSANPTGPLHVGHTRGAVFGDALAALLEFAGNDVTRE